MALAFSVRFDIVDNKGKRSFTKVRVPTTFAIADYIDFAQQMAQLIANISTGRITGASLCAGLDLSTATIKASPSGLSDIAQKGFYQFSTAAPGFRNRVKVPALSEAKVVLGSDAIDQTDADVINFIDAMEDGIVVTGGTISPTDHRENDIVSTDFARELFRKK
jgi:hypothetical protein